MSITRKDGGVAVSERPGISAEGLLHQEGGGGGQCQGTVLQLVATRRASHGGDR